MMSVVVKLGKSAAEHIPGRSDADVIRVLEEWLAEARCGELTFVALCGARPNGNVTSTWTATAGQNSTLAAVTQLRVRVEQAYFQQIESGDFFAEGA